MSVERAARSGAEQVIGGGISLRRVVVLLGAVQFVNVLDFMMVMPLGPDFAAGLRIAPSHLGVVAGSYTAAAAVAGVAGSLFLDRFDRRSALLVALLGLGLGTVLGGLSRGFGSLIGARVIAGLFGGPATSMGYAIVADLIPAERRGRALGAIMGAFAIASVLGVPAGLELARLGGWRLPFFGVGALILLTGCACAALLPRLRGHLGARARSPDETAAGTRAILRTPAALLCLAAAACTTMSVFSVVPNLATYVQFNGGYPRERLGVLYLVGGACSFFGTRVAGRLVDRLGSFPVILLGTIVFGVAVLLGFAPAAPWVSAIALFAGLMTAGALRMVPMSTLASRVPGAEVRARFMSLLSAVQHVAAAGGAMLSAALLDDLPGGKLAGTSGVAAVSLALGLTAPPLLRLVERTVRGRPP